MKDLRFGYSMQFLPDETGSFLQWQYAGKRCHGAFRPNGNVAILNFYLDRSTVTITYRCMDADSELCHVWWWWWWRLVLCRLVTAAPVVWY